MEHFTLEQDIKVFYVTAKSFPEGIMEAHEKLYSMVPFANNGRRYFGVSRPENNTGIVYRAAAEELFQNEAEQHDCETLVIRKGKYLSITVHNYTKDVSQIGKAFQQILFQTGLDPEGYCVEWYLNDKDVKCMIRLKS